MKRLAFCPHCKTAVDDKTACSPFCSERCKRMDLGAWAAEKYRIPVAAEDEDAGEHQPGKNDKSHDTEKE